MSEQKHSEIPWLDKLFNFRMCCERDSVLQTSTSQTESSESVICLSCSTLLKLDVNLIALFKFISFNDIAKCVKYEFHNHSTYLKFTDGLCVLMTTSDSFSINGGFEMLWHKPLAKSSSQALFLHTRPTRTCSAQVHLKVKLNVKTLPI